jgi:hypothetical protein
MTTAGGYKGRRRVGYGVVIAVLILAFLMGYAIYLYFFGGRDGGGGGNGGQDDTRGPSPPPTVLYPTRGIVGGYDLIVIEDHVDVSNGQYTIITTAVGSFRSLIAYGGSSVSGNITHGMAVIRYGGYEIPIVGFASTNSTITQDFPGINVRLDENGGYVFYRPISMAIYYRYLRFNISNTVVHVWVPTKTLPARLADASVHVTIDPEFGVYYLNGVAYGLEIGTPLQRHRGVLRSWIVYTDRSGRYTFTINP